MPADSNTTLQILYVLYDLYDLYFTPEPRQGVPTLKSPNPFSPGFSAPPSSFFGRTDYLERVRSSLEDHLDANRCFFVEGTRGSGKTVLLHQLGTMTRELGWFAFTMNSLHATAELLEVLADEFGVCQTLRASLKPTVTIPGLGSASVGEVRTESQKSQATPLLTTTVIRALRKRSRWKGLFVGIDECQRLDEHDAVEICSAFQEARSLGLPMVLVITGLPGTHDRIGAFPNCTFVKRAPRMVLEPFSVDETLSALATLFAKVPEIRLTEDALFELGHFTQGHPYLVQLVGYHLYEIIDRAHGDELARTKSRICPTEDEIGAAETLAYELYRENILKPVVDPLGAKTIAYLEALAETMDEEGVMANGVSVAQAMGKRGTRETSEYRRSLIDKCILEDLGRGKLGFVIPYIPRYLRERGESTRVVDRTGKWKREL